MSEIWTFADLDFERWLYWVLGIHTNLDFLTYCSKVLDPCCSIKKNLFTFCFLSFRRFLAKKRLNQIRGKMLSDQQDRGAVMFQTLWRGYTARQTFKKMLVTLAQQRNDAATIIQTIWKCYVARKEFLATLQSIVKVQSIVRTKLAVKKFSEAKRSAVAIQTCWRGYRTRKLYSQSVKDVTVVQSCIRR